MFTTVQSYRHATTINTLPDSVLLRIFDFSIMDHDRHGLPFRPTLEWQKLVHVCQKWRRIVFASPDRLDLQLLCTRGTPVRENICLWPPIPLIIDYNWGGDEDENLTLSEEDDVIAALENPDRVHCVGISVTSSLLEKMAAVIQEPFPMLTHLWLSSEDGNVPVLPKAFLGGFAPRLRSAHLERIPFPALSTLLLSATDLVDLQLLNIPKTGFILQDKMVAVLVALTRLESLSIEFQSHLLDRRLLPPPTPITLPSLTSFNFRGVSEYLEDVVAQIDTPLLKTFTITYFNQLTFHIPRLSEFISRTESLDLPQFKRAGVVFCGNCVCVCLECDQAERFEGHFTLQVSCQRLDWQVSNMAQVLSQCFSISTLSSVNDLSINACDLQPGWEEDVDSTGWRGLLSPFTAVETLHISKQLAGHVTETWLPKSSQR